VFQLVLIQCADGVSFCRSGSVKGYIEQCCVDPKFSRFVQIALRVVDIGYRGDYRVG
jgi:hypothetical protein